MPTQPRFTGYADAAAFSRFSEGFFFLAVIIFIIFAARCSGGRKLNRIKVKSLTLSQRGGQSTENLRSAVWPAGAATVGCKNTKSDGDVDVGGGAKVHDVTPSYWLFPRCLVLSVLGYLGSRVSCGSVSSQFLFSQFRIVLVLSVLSVLYSLGYWVFSSLSSFGSLYSWLSWFSVLLVLGSLSSWFSQL